VNYPKKNTISYALQDKHLEEVVYPSMNWGSNHIRIAL